MNVFQMVTDRILELLKNGEIAWQQEWINGMDYAFNRVSMKRYSFLNQILLGHSGEFASYKQWKKLGGQIKKGSKAKFVVFWKVNKYETGKEDDDGEAIYFTRPVLKYYNVFSINDIEGVDPLPKEEYPNAFEADGDAEKVIGDYTSREGVKIINDEDGSQSFYTPAIDTITLPEKKQFKSTEGYYDVLLHELVHSTGHPDRLNRISMKPGTAPFGSKEYSREELVAEMGSAMLMNILGLETDQTLGNNAAYIKNWSKVLESDSQAVVYAAGRAEKAVNFILNDAAIKVNEENL